MSFDLANYGLFAGRSVRRLTRTPEVIINTIAFPILLLLTMLAVFTTAVEAFDDVPFIQRLVPTLVVSGVMFGSVATAVGFFVDLRSGFMDRVRSLDVPAEGPLVGAVAAEIPRALVAVALLLAAGSIAGFRFEGPVAGIVGFVTIAPLAAVSLACIGLALASIAKSQEAVTAPLAAVYLVLLFFSRGFVPLEAYPGWAQPLVLANPASAYVTVLFRLSSGGELLWSTVVALAWSVGLIAVFGSMAVRGLQRASSAS